MIKMRLVGGPWDAEVVEVVAPVPVIELSETEYTLEEGLVERAKHNYVVKGIKGPDNIFYIALHTSLSLKAGMEKLFYETDEDREIRRRKSGWDGKRVPPGY